MATVINNENTFPANCSDLLGLNCIGPSNTPTASLNNFRPLHHKSLTLYVCDVAPLSQGIETAGGVMTNLIPTDATIPYRPTQTFTTDKDNQTGVCLSIFEGERGLVKDNKLLAKFNLNGLEEAARGVPQIEVTFDVDPKGALIVFG